MTSRDEAKGKKAMNDLLNILAKSGVDAKEKLFYHPLDVVSNDSVEKFKKYLVDKFNQVDILVCALIISRYLLIF
jgi:NADP-dependent 3-hydroxy acid dehydrogenase YdfG